MVPILRSVITFIYLYFSLVSYYTFTNYFDNLQVKKILSPEQLALYFLMWLSQDFLQILVV